MANSALGIIIKAQDQFSGTFGKLKSDMTGVKSAASGAGLGIGTLSRAIGALGISVGVAQIVGFTKEIAMMGARADEVSRYYDNMTKSVGASSAELLRGLQAATDGTVTQIELMKAANNALLMGANASQLPTIMTQIKALAESTGQDVVQMFNQFVEGTVKMRTVTLAGMGILVDADNAYREYAASIGKVSSELTDAEKRIGFYNAAMKELGEKTKLAGDVGVTAADKIDRIRTAWEDLRTAAGKQIILSVDIEAGAGVMEFLTAYLNGDSDEMMGALVKRKMFAGSPQRKNTTYGPWSYPLTPPPVYGGATNTGGMNPPTSAAGVAAILSIATAAEREAEAKRRAGEYQSIYNDRLAEQKRIMDGILSRAQSVLGAGATGPSQADMLATEAGTYQDKPMEAALRLQAIAERGFAEIKKHADWASILMIPPEVLAGSEAGLKNWASQTRGDVLGLLRPDLINWEAFVRDYKTQLENEAIKQNVLDVIIPQKLKEAGLWTGESSKNIGAQILGIDSPQTAADSFASGFGEAIGNKDLSNLFLSAWQSDFDSGKDSYKTAGAALGGVIIEGVNTGVKDNLPGVRSSIAYYVAPEVARILNEKDPKK